MAGITVKTANGKTTYAVGDRVMLTAEAPPGATAYQWKHDGTVVGAAQNSFEFDMAADSGGEYTVEAKAVDASSLTGSIKLTVGTAESPEPQPVFHATFANIVAAILAVLGVGLLLFIGPWNHGGISDADWTALAGPLKVAVILGLPATLFGSLVLLVGVWMAVVDWRGRLQDEKPTTEAKPAPDGRPKGAITGEDVAKVVVAVGNLRGAALAMVVGAILLLGSAWVAQSAAGTGDDAGASSPPSAAPAPEATAAPGPT